MWSSFLLFILVVLSRFCMFKTTESQCLPECRNIPQIGTNSHLLNLNNKPLKTVYYHIILAVPKNNCTKIKQCYVNSTKIMELYKFDENPVLAIVDFYCHDPSIIQMTTYQGNRQLEGAAYVQINNCSFSKNSYDVLGTMFRPLQLLMRNAGIPTNYTVLDDTNSNMENCTIFKDVSTLWFHNSPNALYPLTLDQIIDILSCSSEFPNVKDLTLNNVLLNLSVFDLPKTFPNIVALEITSAGLQKPIQFPWKESSLILPRNLSSSTLTLDHYANAHHITVESNNFRTILDLSRNTISNLKNYSMNGDLQKIRLSGNGIEDVSVNLFKNVQGLEHIDLSMNKLQNLPSLIFRGLSLLKHIDINSNNLSAIPEDLFQDNDKLIYLDFSKNSIKKISQNVFLHLQALEVVHLENNRIITLENLKWPVFTSNLQRVFFDENPLSHLPEFIFYLRNIRTASFKNTQISFKNFTEYVSNLKFILMAEQLTKGNVARGDFTNDQIAENPAAIIDIIESRIRVIDLTGCKIDHLDLIYFGTNRKHFNVNQHIKIKLILILKYFKLVLADNPLICDCNIVQMNRFIHGQLEDGYIDDDAHYFKDWRCNGPKDMKGRQMINIPESETYCEKTISNCPSNCTCYERAITSITIVDCRNRQFLSLPNALPNGILDVLLQNNNITTLSDPTNTFLPRIRQLFLSENKIVSISNDVIMKMKNIRILYLDSNYLVSLPTAIGNLQLSSLNFINNPLKCDCHTKWMKHWMLQISEIIHEVTDVTCNVDDENEKGKFFITVPDDEFLCLEDFDSVKHVIIPSVTCSVVLITIMILICLMYLYRLEVKVLLFIYFGIHPFDKDDTLGKEIIDVLVLHSEETTDWVMENVVKYLEFHKNYFVVCEMMRDFVAGFTYLENIASVVKHSKRMLIVLSPDFVEDDLLKVAWNEAQEKIIELRTNYAIVICHDVTIKDVMIKDMQRYIKRGRYIDAKQALFHEKLLYSMPQYKDTSNKNKSLPDIKHFINETYGEENQDNIVYKKHAFVSYSDSEMPYIMNELRPTLENNGYLLCLPDRDFLPGASKEENVLKAIDSSIHTLFILSGNHLQDEWSVFTFRIASEKSLRVRSNHLIVIIGEDTDLDAMDDEVRFYIKTHVTLHVNEKWFIKKLLNSLPDIEEHLPNIIQDLGNGFQHQIENGIQRYGHREIMEEEQDVDLNHQTIVAEINHIELENLAIENGHHENGTIQFVDNGYVPGEDIQIELDNIGRDDDL